MGEYKMIDEKKVLKDYSLYEINKVLYHDKSLLDNKRCRLKWSDEKYKLKQIFDKYSPVNSSDKFHIPLLWVPIVKALMKALIEIDPYIHFFQIREVSGELEVYVKPSSSNYEELIQQQIIGATMAIDTITLIQLELFNKSMED